MIGAETSYVPSTDAVEVAVHDFGGSGPLLVLGHATGFCAHTLGPIVERLVDRFHCVAIDFRAHGRTELPAGAGLSWFDLADDLASVVRALSPGQPVLGFGHSMGATSIILSELATPGLFERAWAFEPVLLPDAPVLTGDDGPEIAKIARARRSTFASREEARERYASRLPLSRLDPRALQAYVDHGMVDEPDGTVRLRCRPEHEASVFEHHNTGANVLVADLAIPYAVGIGGPSPAERGEGPAEWIRQAAATNPDLLVLDYPDLSHFGPLEQPDRLAEDAARFLLPPHAAVATPPAAGAAG